MLVPHELVFPLLEQFLDLRGQTAVSLGSWDRLL
jgi:hypothetical protein